MSDYIEDAEDTEEQELAERSLAVIDQLDRIAETVWAECLRFCKPDCCVLATRVFCNVAREFGHEADGISVLAVAEADMLRVVLGGRPKEKNGFVWCGHLAASVKAGGELFLVDTSIAQMESMSDRIKVQPIVMKVDEAVLSGRAVIVAELPCGARLSWRRWDGNHDGQWREAPDWQPSTLNQAITQASLAKMRGREYDYPKSLTMLAAMGVRL